MKTDNYDSFLLPECNVSLVASSRLASHGTSLLNHWIDINRCGRQTIKQLVTIIPISLLLVQVPMPTTQAVPLIQCSNVSFQPQTIFAVGRSPYSITLGDFNGDDNPDFATANGGSSRIVSVLLGNGDGTFQPYATIAAGDSSFSIIAGDFNSDGNQDLATTNPIPNDVSVLLGNGNGTFQPHATFDVGDTSFSNSITVGDFNSDGNQDLATTDTYSNTVSVLLGNGNGTFQPYATFAVGASSNSINVGDFNGDGKQDLATANSEANDVSVLLGNGDGTFQPHATFAVGGFPSSLTVGDFNSDGQQDLATAIGSAVQDKVPVASAVSVLLGNGNGTFQPYANFAVMDGPYFITVGDLNGDGKQDLVTANTSTDTVSVLPGNGNGTFQPYATFAVGRSPYSLTVGDVNGDGKQDLATSNTFSRSVSVLLNSCTPGVVPDNTAPSTEVTYTPSDLSKPIQITAKDLDSGLGSIAISSANNAKVTIPSFQPGTKNPVAVTVKPIDPSRNLSFQVRLTDQASNVSTSDLATLTRNPDKPIAINSLTKVIQQESLVQILNSTLGLNYLQLSVNGTNFRTGRLVDNEVRVIDISSTLKVENTLTFKGLGKPNSTALIWIREPSTP